MDPDALWLTFRLASASTLILLLIAIPLAWWLASGVGPVRAIAWACVSLPLVLPPTVLGYYLLLSMGPLTPPGRFLIRVLGHPLAFSFQGLLVGSVLYSLPFAVQPLITGFRSVLNEYGEAAATLGASPLRMLLRVVLPLAKGSLLTAAVLAFSHTVGEFGVVLMIGGNIPGLTRTLSLSLYDMVEAGQYSEANRTAGLLVGFSLLALLLVYTLPGRSRRDGSVLE